MSDVFDVDQACCHLYTESNFNGDKLEVCAGAHTLPEDFVVKRVDSWVCGPESEVGFTEAGGEGGLYN